MTEGEPLDLSQVAADDEALEQLSSRRAVDVPPDVALVLLRELLDDVDTDAAPARTSTGTTVLSIAGDDRASRGLARGAAVVGVLAAGLLSLGGVAAASTLVPVDTPLSGLGHAVRSAAGAVVDAVTPPDAVRPAPRPEPQRPEAVPVEPPPPAVQRPAAPGPDVSAAQRSRAAAPEVTALLDGASSLLDAGRTDAAARRLGTAERRLADVLPADRGPLQERLARLQDRLAAARSAPVAPPATKPRPTTEPPAEERKKEPAAEPQGKRESKPARRGDDRSKTAPDEEPKDRGERPDTGAPVRGRAG